MGKNGRMLSHEVDNIIAKRNQRLFDAKAKKLRDAERAAKQVEKLEAKLAKLKGEQNG
jgi:hypothetical protein